jgi:hypothetical protein
MPIARMPGRFGNTSSRIRPQQQEGKQQQILLT